MKYCNYIIVFLLFTAFYASAQPTEPILRIETGMHTAEIKRVATDANGQYVLTCSHDKTARLWDATTGKLLNTLRIPISKGNEGKQYACAISPDGRIAAVGGWTGYDWDGTDCTYILNTQTGEIIARLLGSKNVINDLEFSPDGRWLAAGTSSGNGIYIYDVNSWHLYRYLEGYDSDVYGLSFSNDGRLATTCYDGKVRLYNAQFSLQKEVTTTGKRPPCIAWHPAGDRLAIGYDNFEKIEIRSGYDLSLKTTPTGEWGKGEGFFTVSFSKDGTRLFGGGSQSQLDANGNWMRTLRIWENAGQGTFSDIDMFKNSLMDCKPLPNGRLVVAGSYPDIAVVDNSNKTLWYSCAPNNDYASRNKSHFRINTQANIIGFTPFGEPPLTYNVLSRSLQQESALYPAPVTEVSGTEVTSWEEDSMTCINKKRITFFEKFEFCKSADISNDGHSIALGTNWDLYLSNDIGGKLWGISTPGMVNAVNISGNDKVVAAALDDGTIRWYSMEDGRELLAFYLHSDKKRWVLFTPQGYYDASAGAEDLIGWHINNGKDKAPSFYPASRFRDKYYRPDIIDAIFETYNDSTAVTLANSRRHVPIQPAIQQALPPEITIVSPMTGSTVNTPTVTIHYKLKTQGDVPVTRIIVQVNGRPVTTVEGTDKINTSGFITVTLPEGRSTVTLLAENIHGNSPDANIHITYNAPTPAAPVKPNLYVLAIGISAYHDKHLKLNYAHADAQSFIETFKKQKGKLYNNVVVKLLTDEHAHLDSIADGLDWIRKETGSKDVAMIFFAGHGMNDNNATPYMMAVNADPDRLMSTCLNSILFTETTKKIPGKVVVFIDACHSGGATGVARRAPDMNSIVNELVSSANGSVVFASCDRYEFSLEDAKWGHGLFTQALLEGLSGSAVIPGTGKITVKSLDAYVSERVKILSNKQQHPVTPIPLNVPDFTIAVMDN